MHMIVIMRVKSDLMLQNIVFLLYVTHEEEEIKAEKERGYM